MAKRGKRLPDGGWAKNKREEEAMTFLTCHNLHKA